MRVGPSNKSRLSRICTVSPGLIEAIFPEHVYRLAPARRWAGNLKQKIFEISFRVYLMIQIDFTTVWLSDV